MQEPDRWGARDGPNRARVSTVMPSARAYGAATGSFFGAPPNGRAGGRVQPSGARFRICGRPDNADSIKREDLGAPHAAFGMRRRCVSVCMSSLVCPAEAPAVGGHRLADVGVHQPGAGACDSSISRHAPVRVRAVDRVEPSLRARRWEVRQCRAGPTRPTHTTLSVSATRGRWFRFMSLLTLELAGLVDRLGQPHTALSHAQLPTAG